MTAPESTPAAESRASRTPPLTDVPSLAAQAADLLRLPHSLAPLSPDDARCVVNYLRLVSYPKGAAVLREGDAGAAYMLLVLEGEVEVDAGSGPDSTAIAVLGPGSILGEMALLDGSPRSATCTAVSAVRAAGLSRKGLEALLQAHPAVAARLALGLAQRIGERLRALGQQLQIYAQLNASQKAELDRLGGRVPR
jgi:CRP/FNR family transcriptional regulator, cyclic AMP receptor protein